MDKVQKYNSFNTNTPSSESYRNYKLKVFENKVVKKILVIGPKMKEVVKTQLEKTTQREE